MAFYQIRLTVQTKKHKHPVEFEVTAALARETMAILHATAHAIIRDLDRRFVNTGIVTDLLSIFEAEVKHERIECFATCEEPLKKVAKDFNVTEESFYKAWKELQMRKEVELAKVMKRQNMKREDVKIDDGWPQVLSTIDESGNAQIAAAKPALGLLLMLEATNCGV